MQNRYTGDSGDFGKYGLLRALSGQKQDSTPPLLTLGVLWYLTPDESHNADGKHTAYLDCSKQRLNQYASCDHDLYRELEYLVHSGNRSVAAVQQSDIFRKDHTTYFSDLLDYSQVQTRPNAITSARESYRRDWLEKARKALEGSQIIFLDPDRGLEPASPPGHQSGHRHAYLEDLTAVDPSGLSTSVIYHHTARTGPAQYQARTKLALLAEATGTRAFAMLYHRGSSRSFLIAPAPDHHDLIVSRARHMLQGPWQRHFSVITL